MSKKILMAACALSLLSATGAFAADHHGGGGGAPHGGGGGAPHMGGGGFHGGGAPAHVGVAGGGGARQGGGFHGSAHVSAAPRTSGGAHFGGAAHTARTNTFHGARGANTRARGGVHAGHVVGAAVAGAAVGAAMAHHAGAGAHHYSPQAYPHEVKPAHQYHFQGQWNRPGGWYYRRWSYGDRLPGGWFAQQFWLTNFALYGLAPAPYDYAWVRQGPDALLVNVYNGTVVEVEYGVFY